MCSKLCQSGLDDAERDRAATVDVAVEGTQASRASILPTSVWEREEDDRKVAGACSEALRRLKTTSTAGEGGPVSQRPPKDGLQSLSDGTVNIRSIPYSSSTRVSLCFSAQNDLDSSSSWVKICTSLELDQRLQGLKSVHR